MFSLKSKLIAVFSGLLLLASPLAAQDSKAILDALVRKGVLSSDEADAIKQEAKSSAPVYAVGGKKVSKLSLGARIQIQYAGLSTDIDGTNNDPASTSHFFARRVYLTTKAQLGPDWSMNITYDPANQSFDKAIMSYGGSDIDIDIGLRKVEFGLEETTSSSKLKAIERTGVTRYFVESNNGRRLGAGSYRLGVFASGKSGNFVYGGAITNPERVGDPTSAGNSGNNNMAYWANAGFEGDLSDGSYAFGAAIGILPDQGGKTVGAGDDLTAYSIYGNVTSGNFHVMAEYLAAKVEHGASATMDATPTGYWLQGAYKFTKSFEGVARFSYLDTDGRGVKLSDGVRSAPAGNTDDKLTEYFVGGNWYIIGNDLKFQAGYVYGESEDKVSGGASSATTSGIRSQMQINF